MSPDLPEVKAGDASPVAAHSTTRAKPTAAPPTQFRAPSDLELGSHTSKSQAGPLSVLIDYWTDQPASSWHGQSALVNFTLRVARDVGETSVKISRVRVTADGKSVLLEDRGEFAVQPPFSYGSGFTTPRTSDGHTKIDLQVDLLIETEPGSGTYFRQTVFDTLNLTFQGRAR